ncbi:MAG TPA: DUF3618 domain-containing protein [Dongiaceae bacterium]|nr:DUF3618 domain-containing protein [Dongiaceae bacterium]
MATETERLERETEQTRAQLEQTLGELRARMSPGQLLDQASDYFRNSSGRAYLHNLRDEVVHNPVPITLIGAGIAWLALSGAIGRRGNGRANVGRDWGRNAGIADDLSHGGRDPSAMRRAKDAAQGWASEASDAISETEERWRERAEDVGDRVSTAYDETVGRVRQTAEDWTDEARSSADEARQTLRDGVDRVRERVGEAGDTVREGVDQMRERTGELYERTASGFRRVTRQASHYGQVARDAARPDGALLNFCREQPMLVAGLGVAFGAALAAMIPSSRTEREAMGETSRRMQDRIKETASDTWRAVGGERLQGQDDDQGRRSEQRFEQAANDSGSTATQQSNAGRSEQPEYATRRESWQSDAMGSREAAAEVERGVKQSNRASNIETEPSRAPYAEAAEAGASGTVPGEESKQRT